MLRRDACAVAMNAHQGAVVLRENDVIYIDKLDEWPDDIVGKKINATGHMRKEKRIPDPAISPPSAGAYGEQTYLTSAKWELAKSE